MTDEASKQIILAVDDSPENIEILGGLLSEEYKMKAATNGLVALKIAQSKPHPDLILLDVSMPGMDGYEVCQELKVHNETRDIPVIFVTAATEVGNIASGFKAGAVDYVTKPFNSSELLARISTHLSLKAAREKLEDLSAKLGKYLSPNVYSSIFLGERDVTISSYRKVLTVCFTDIVNFTPQAEEMDHETLTSWLNNHLNEMAQITQKYGGTLDKFMGDAVMVFFGDPKSAGIEADAIKCVEMAKEMVSKVRENDIEIRAGINTGMCTVGNFGSEDRMDYTIIGKEVNVAARLESNSAPGKILISESSYEFLKEHFKCVPQEKIKMKGIERDINTYCLED